MKRALCLFGVLLYATASTAVLAQAAKPDVPDVGQGQERPKGSGTLTGSPAEAERPKTIIPYTNKGSGFIVPHTVEGQAVDIRAPEKADDGPLFPGQVHAPYHATAPYNITIITDKLKQPWSLAFLPDGKMLVTEKITGNLLLVDGSGKISPPFKGVPAVVAVEQVGLLDLALDPNFAKNHRLFFSYAESAPEAGSPVKNFRIVVAHATLDEAGQALNNVQVIFRAAVPPMPTNLALNTGGRIAIAKDGTLFLTIGDSSVPPPWDKAQRLDTDLGKIVHFTADGAPAKNNPFLNKAGVLPEIWSYGHRSNEGLAFDPATGALWDDGNGPRGGDTLEHVLPGKNYGYPLFSHGIDYPGTPIGAGQTSAPGTEQPVYYWDPATAPSGLAFYRGNLFPQWKNSIFVGELRGQVLDRLELKGGKVVAEEPLLTELKERVRDVRVSAAGEVFVLTDNRNGTGKLLKLTPKK